MAAGVTSQAIQMSEVMHHDPPLQSPGFLQFRIADASQTATMARETVLAQALRFRQSRNCQTILCLLRAVVCG